MPYILQYITVYYSILQHTAVYQGTTCTVLKPTGPLHCGICHWSISLQHVREVELREGREHPVDKKTVRK